MTELSPKKREALSCGMSIGCLITMKCLDIRDPEQVKKALSNLAGHLHGEGRMSEAQISNCLDAQLELLKKHDETGYYAMIEKMLFK